MRVIHTKLIKTFGWIILSSFLISLPVYAEEIGASVDLIAEIEPTLQVVVPTGISLNLTPNLDGSPAFVKEDLNILVATNNPTGYHLSLQTDSTNLTNNTKDKEGNFSVLETISSELSEENFTTNRWGYKYNTENYIPFTTNINLNSTKVPTNRDDITLTFGAKADITKPAGTYSLALNFTAVTNMIPGVLTINYNGNGATNGNIVSQKIEMGTSQKLTSNENGFSREDHVFLNWNTSPDGNGTSYSENELYSTTLTTENKSLNLYAIWGLSMQDYTLAKCQQEATNNPVTVYDERDKNDYTIRYINGNCWQTRNLNLALTTGMTLESETTNIATEYIYGTVSDLTTGHSSEDARAKYSGTKEGGWWYNYYAVTAGIVSGEENSEESLYDICPKGWGLPNLNQSESLALFNTWSDTYSSVFTPIVIGWYGDGELKDKDTRGIWWTSSSPDAPFRMTLQYNPSNGLMTYYANRIRGMSVRCVRKN